MREETLAKQKALGTVPPDTQLAPRPASIPAWKDLSPDQQRVYARMQELYAGFVEHTDHEFGRLLETLDKLGELDNTLIIITSDNGASGEGGDNGALNEMAAFNGTHDELPEIMTKLDELGTDRTYNHYPAGWALAGNTPLKFWKQITHEGGVRDPFIIAWPQRIKDQGGIRGQFVHVIDVAPTIFELTGIQPAAVINGVEQKPIEGVSFANTLDNPQAPTQKTQQYFEMLGNRGIWAGGWKAVTFHGRLPWVTGVSNPDFAADTWELYKPDQDFAEVHDLAAQYPQKLAELQSLWNTEALLYNVYPLNDSTAQRVAATNASFTKGKTLFTYRDGDVRIPEPLSPPIKNRSHTITAYADIPASGAEGMLVTCGGRFAGYAFYIQDGHLHYTYNYLNEAHYDIVSKDPVPAGRVELRFTYEKVAPGRAVGKLFINGQAEGQGNIDRVVPGIFSPNETFDVGRDTGTPVIDTYSVPFRFTGTLASLEFKLADDPNSLFFVPEADPFDD